MKNKLFFGIILIFIGLYQIFGEFINLEAFDFLFNYHFILIIVGIYLLFKHKGQSVIGVFLIALGLYLHLKDFIDPAYLDTITSLIIIIVGGSLVYLSFRDKKIK